MSAGIRLVECSYAGGFFDGEGYVGLRRSRYPDCKGYTYSLLMQIGQDDRRPLDWMAERWGGKVVIAKTPRARRIHHRWNLFGRSAASFLADVEPFLIVKGRQAQLAIAFQSTRKQGWAAGGCRGLSDEYRAYCEQVYQSIKALNQMASKHPDMDPAEVPELKVVAGGKA